MGLADKIMESGKHAQIKKSLKKPNPKLSVPFAGKSSAYAKKMIAGPRGSTFATNA